MGYSKSEYSHTSGCEIPISLFFIEQDSSNIYVTELFYVQLKQQEDFDILVRYAAEHNVKIVEEGAFQLWYILSCTEQSKGNALEMANMFYESGLFAETEAEFLNANRFTCVNDPYFSQQWNLLNTGQKDINHAGVDINDNVSEGDIIGKTGTTGNARNMVGDEQHLHFEYRTGGSKLGRGLKGREDPNIIVDTKFERDPSNENKVKYQEVGL